VERKVLEFTSEDDLKTFEGWMRYQGVDPATTSPEDLAEWHHIFDDVTERAAKFPKVGRMKLQPVPGELRYAVAVEDGANLWLVLWVRRSRKGEFFVMRPCGDRDWDVHTSYHLDGALHMKSFDRKVFAPAKCQPLNGVFRGSQDLGFYAGYGPKGVGAICDPNDFSAVVAVAPGVLGPRDGGIKVDLVEPGHEPPEFAWAQIVSQHVFRDSLPWVVISVGRVADPAN
jgi:hypothetical protein